MPAWLLAEHKTAHQRAKFRHGTPFLSAGSGGGSANPPGDSATPPSEMANPATISRIAASLIGASAWLSTERYTLPTRHNRHSGAASTATHSRRRRRHIGGSARGYQELSASLAAWQSRLRPSGKLARLHIYASAPLIQMSASAADRTGCKAFSRVACRGRAASRRGGDQRPCALSTGRGLPGIPVGLVQRGSDWSRDRIRRTVGLMPESGEEPRPRPSPGGLVVQLDHL